MAQPALNQRLSSMDASFLYFEKPEAPLHVGSTHTFEGQIDFEEFVAHMASKLPLIPRYRQKVTPAPFNVGHPSWEWDDNFDIRKHIYRLELDKPGTERQLSELSGRIQSTVMDRNKPLWEVYIVYGLDGDRTAMIMKVHHAMVDGVSGVDIGKIVFEISPDPKPTPPPADDKPLTTVSTNLTNQLIEGFLASAEETSRSWFQFQSSLLNFTQTLLNNPNPNMLRPGMELIPRMATPLQPMPFNKPQGSTQKLFTWKEVSFAEARAIRASLGGTVNDVVLTTLSGAIARYVEAHGVNVQGRILRVMVPVSMRKEDQRGALGNLVSVLPVEIPMDIKDPVERLKSIHGKTDSLKGAKVAESVNLFSALMGIIPAPLQAMAGSMPSSSVPVFNTVCTNVPGPQIPLYVVGHRQLSWWPFVPVGFAVGLSCGILSYDQKLAFGLTADAEAMPDIWDLVDYLDQSFVELRKAAGVQPTSTPPVVAAATHRKTRARTTKPKAETPSEKASKA